MRPAGIAAFHKWTQTIQIALSRWEHHHSPLLPIDRAALGREPLERRPPVRLASSLANGAMLDETLNVEGVHPIAAAARQPERLKL